MRALGFVDRDVKLDIQIWSDWPPNGINLGLGEPKCTETNLKKSKICPIRGQSDLVLMTNLISLFVDRVEC